MKVKTHAGHAVKDLGRLGPTDLGSGEDVLVRCAANTTPEVSNLVLAVTLTRRNQKFSVGAFWALFA